MRLMHVTKTLPKSIEYTIRHANCYAVKQNQTFGQANNSGTRLRVAYVQVDRRLLTQESRATAINRSQEW